VNSPVRKLDPPVGLLNDRLKGQAYSHQRFYPSTALLPFIEHYWHVAWQLSKDSADDDARASPPVTQAVLTHPCVHISMEAGQIRLYGVQRRLFKRSLLGHSQVLGIKFRVGGFYPYTYVNMAALTDKRLGIEALADSTLKTRLMQYNREFASMSPSNEALTDLIYRLDQQLLKCKPTIDAALEKDMQGIDNIIQLIRDKPLFKVAQICQHSGYSPRQIQRLCQKMIGVSPKWLINRYRMHWIATRLQQAQVDWNEIIDRCAYTDQAHLIKDFKKHTGLTPAAYIRDRLRDSTKSASTKTANTTQ